MSDAAQSPSHRTPDLMDLEFGMEELKQIPREALVSKSDDDEPGPSVRLRKSAGQVMRSHRHGHPGRFMWIWMLGVKIPALVVDGEPHLPIEIIDELLCRDDSEGAEAFQKLLMRTNVYIKTATTEQYKMYRAKSEICKKMRFPEICMMGRSDIERIMGELREESWPTNVEHEEWNDADCVHVVHVNFIDLCEKWLEDDDDIEEDMMECGTHGYWYKSRVNMRCIKCRECEKRFTPTDFILHHHNPLPPHGMVHHGLTSANWHQIIEIHKDDRTEENETAWRKFVMNAHRIGKRNYSEAEPQEPKVVEVAMEVDEEEIIAEPAVKKIPIVMDDCKAEVHIPLQLEDPKHRLFCRKPKNRLEEIIKHHVNPLSKAEKKELFAKSHEDFLEWLREAEFTRRIMEQREDWKRLRKKCKPMDSAMLSMDPLAFVNLREIGTASKSVKEEIQAFGEALIALDKSRPGWLVKEQKLVQGLSDEARRVLDNKPSNQILKPAILKPIPLTIPPMTINQMAQFAQSLVAQHPIPFGSLKPLPVPLPPATTTSVKSIKPVTPVKSPRVSAPIVLPKVITPITPITPMTPITPLSPPNMELLKHQLSMAMTNPQLFPIFYPKLPTTAYEQLSKFLKATTVQN